MNIFVGMFDIAGYFSGLSTCLRESGIRVDEYYLKDNRFKYKQQNYYYFSVFRWLTLRIERASILLRVIYKILHNVFMLPFFLVSIVKYDSFILYPNSFFFYGLKKTEFLILKVFGKNVLFIFCGSDSRPPYMSGLSTKLTKDELVFRTNRLKEFIQSFNNKVDFVIDLPATSQFHLVQVVDFFKIGIPKDIQAFKPRQNPTSKLRILHAPSNEAYKGTKVFEAVLAELALKYSFEYVTITNRTNSEVCDLIKSADLVIDELYSDTLMAVLGTECAWLGTPYLVFGEKLELAAKEYNWPIKNYGKPDEVGELIEKFIAHSELRYEAALALQSFVMKNWSSLSIAENILKLLNNGPSTDLLVNQKLVMEMDSGWGAPFSEIKRMTSMVNEVHQEKIIR